jgi:hypothetical protein
VCTLNGMAQKCLHTWPSQNNWCLIKLSFYKPKHWGCLAHKIKTVAVWNTDLSHFKGFQRFKSTFMYYSLLFKCLIGVFNYNIFMRVKFKATLLVSSIFWKVSSRLVCWLFG